MLRHMEGTLGNMSDVGEAHAAAVHGALGSGRKLISGFFFLGGGLSRFKERGKS